MEAGKNSVIYMGLISGPNKADDTCGPTTGTMDRGFTVLTYSFYFCKLTFYMVNFNCVILKYTSNILK
jgi:hypothetical protein